MNWVLASGNLGISKGDNMRLFRSMRACLFCLAGIISASVWSAEINSRAWMNKANRGHAMFESGDQAEAFRCYEDALFSMIHDNHMDSALQYAQAVVNEILDCEENRRLPSSGQEQPQADEDPLVNLLGRDALETVCREKLSRIAMAEELIAEVDMDMSRSKGNPGGLPDEIQDTEKIDQLIRQREKELRAKSEKARESLRSIILEIQGLELMNECS